MKLIKNEQQAFYQLITMPLVFPINCYLILEEDSCTLIDCSKNGQGTKIAAALQNLQKTHPLKYIIITHAHSDHVGDLQDLRKTFPQAKVAISNIEMQRLAAKDTVEFLIEPDILLEGGEKIGSLEVMLTPGHTSGSITLYDTRTDIAFVGDLLQTRGGLAIAGDTRILFPFPSMGTDDMQAAIFSTEAFLAKYPQTKLICCGHGMPVTQKEAIVKVLERAKKKLK